MAASDPQVRIEMLEQALHWAHLTIQKKDVEIQTCWSGCGGSASGFWGRRAKR